MCTEAVFRRLLPCLWVAALGGCLNPDDILPVRGTVDAAHQRVIFSRAPTLSPTSCGEWTELDRTFTDDAGAYAFEVFRAQALTFSTGQTFCFRVDTVIPFSLVASATMFTLSGEAQVPRIADWSPELELGSDGAWHFTPYRERGDAGTFFLRHVVRLHDGARDVWVATDAQWNERGFAPVPMDLDDRILSEFDATLRLSAAYVESNATENPLVQLVTLPRVEATLAWGWEFGHGPFAASRGAGCDFLGWPCALTDGQLFSESLRQLPWIQVNFDQPLRPELVVVRALVVHSNVVKISGVLPDDEVVELATHRLSRELDAAPRPLRDGGTEPGPNFFSVRLDAGVELKALRLEAEGLVSAQEVSVF